MVLATAILMVPTSAPAPRGQGDTVPYGPSLSGDALALCLETGTSGGH